MSGGFPRERNGRRRWLLLSFLPLYLCLGSSGATPPGYVAGEQLPGPTGMGGVPGEWFSSSGQCRECHVQEGEKWEGGFRPRAFSNPFVQAEYRLAWAKARKDGGGVDLPASCLACHSPILYLKGIIPKPGEPLVSEDEGISCDFCHSTWGYQGAKPGHFNWIFRKGGNRFGPMIRSATGKERRWVQSPELCGTCHNEMGPGGHWVKSVYDEWAESPYAKGSEKGCRDCHEQFTRDFVNGMIRGCVDLKVQVLGPPGGHAEAGDMLEIAVTLTSSKAGHRVPAGSAELRQLWLHLEAVDASGTIHPLAVTAKGFEGEEFTLGSPALAYQDIGEFEGKMDFPGLPRDGEGISAGDRIFRLPMFDAKGRMTALEWNAFTIGHDFRIRPGETVVEKAAWAVPSGLPAGPLAIRATLSYRRCPPALWAFLGLPPGGNPILAVSRAEAKVVVP